MARFAIGKDTLAGSSTTLPLSATGPEIEPQPAAPVAAASASAHGARTIMLLEAPIVPTLAKLALPNLVVMLMQSSVGLTETHFIGKLGTDALAGMALVFPPLMLVQMISAGAVGGGIMTAVARALGRRDTAGADVLVWQAVWTALALGLATSAIMLACGPALYAVMGGSGASLRAAEAYAAVVFGGATLIWLFNSLAAVIRGTGNMMLPALVSGIGAVLLVPASPVFIFGLGPFPALGIVGGGVAVLIYYGIGSCVFALYLAAGKGGARLSRRPRLPHGAALREIAAVGALSSLVTISTNVTIATATGFAGHYGDNAVAGYGTGVRLEYLLVPLAFGLCTPVGAMVGTTLGAGDRARAVRVALAGAAMTGLATFAVGIVAAILPAPWLALFGRDPAMIATGSAYLRLVGPFYGFFGLSLAFYFVAQGARRLLWPLLGSFLRVLVSIGGAALAVRLGYGIDGVFLSLGIGLLVAGLTGAFAFALGGIIRRP